MHGKLLFTPYVNNNFPCRALKRLLVAVILLPSLSCCYLHHAAISVMLLVSSCMKIIVVRMKVIVVRMKIIVVRMKVIVVRISVMLLVRCMAAFDTHTRTHTQTLSHIHRHSHTYTERERNCNTHTHTHTHTHTRTHTYSHTPGCSFGPFFFFFLLGNWHKQTLGRSFAAWLRSIEAYKMDRHTFFLKKKSAP